MAVSTKSHSSNLESEVKKYGCPKVVSLDRHPGHEQIPYLDLLPGRARAPLLPRAVAEFQGRPLLYFIEETAADGAPKREVQEIRDLQQLLANRGEHAFLAVVQPGQMEVYPINLDRARLANVEPKIITVADPRAPFFFQSLASGTDSFEGTPSEADFVFKEIHDLLKGASDELASPSGAMQPLEVLSATGRALFFRFLIDRQIVRPDDLDQICPQITNGDLKDVFSDPDKAASTSVWLDETFNGDLLPLVEGLAHDASSTTKRKRYLEFYKTAKQTTNNRLFLHLGAILRGWKHVGGSQFQVTIDWNDLNFAHIPIGVLSQVYETFSHRWDKSLAVETSVHYTPRKIAQLVVVEALAGIKGAEKAHVLDPACGAGVFLVLALRELIRLRWKSDGRRPNKATIHKILYEQLCGFDISEHALRLAALALYITAIELNAITRPPRLHKAPKSLQGTVLHNCVNLETDADPKRRFVSGSLSDKVPITFNNRFDVVLGNPPWTPLRAEGKTSDKKKSDNERVKKLNFHFTNIARRVLKERGLEKIAKTYYNPNNVPDLAFVWRSAEWAKPGGIVAMTLDARLILTPEGTYKDARNALMRGFEITGVFNGSDLEETQVWPNMKMPFIALFARNSIPSVGHSFHFLTPIRENSLCNRGEFRLDYQSAQTVSIEDVERFPWLLKTLTVGTSLDVELVEKLIVQSPNTIGSIWQGAGLVSGRGFSLNPRKSNKAPDWLLKLPLFEPTDGEFLPSLRKSKTFEEVYGNREPYQTCGKEIYQAPLLLIPQTPGEDRVKPKSYRIQKQAVCYNQSYYGYSGGAHPDGKLLIAILHLLVHSRLFRYFCLVRSSRIGASWRTFIKDDLDAFPFPDVKKLTRLQIERIPSLANELEQATPKPWQELDNFVYKLYRLSANEVDVVEETVAFRSPYRTARLPAEAPPTEADIGAFASCLEETLQPLFSVAGQKTKVTTVPTPDNGWNAPWRFVNITFAGDNLDMSSMIFGRLMRAVGTSSASRVIMPVGKGGLAMGLLNQRRFWTRSRARLCALYLSREHLDKFPLPSNHISKRRKMRA
jgi:type I restriction-modification system DNA methylase subunit